MVTAEFRRGMSVFDSAHSTMEREAPPFVLQLRKRMEDLVSAPLRRLSLQIPRNNILLSSCRNLWFWQFFGCVVRVWRNESATLVEVLFNHQHQQTVQLSERLAEVGRVKECYLW